MLYLYIFLNLDFLPLLKVLMLPSPVLAKATSVQSALLSQLRRARKSTPLTQAQLAASIDINRMTVHRLENEPDMATTRLSTFIAMALALGLEPTLVPMTNSDVLLIEKK